MLCLRRRKTATTTTMHTRTNTQTTTATVVAWLFDDLLTSFDPSEMNSEDVVEMTVLAVVDERELDDVDDVLVKEESLACEVISMRVVVMDTDTDDDDDDVERVGENDWSGCDEGLETVMLESLDS